MSTHQSLQQPKQFSVRLSLQGWELIEKISAHYGFAGKNTMTMELLVREHYRLLGLDKPYEKPTQPLTETLDPNEPEDENDLVQPLELVR